MTNREKFKRRVIELIHGLPYDEAIKKDKKANSELCESLASYTGYCYIQPLPITIGRLMQALANIDDLVYTVGGKGVFRISGKNNKYIYAPAFSWKLAKENGIECSDDDQSDETIEKILSVLI